MVHVLSANRHHRKNMLIFKKDTPYNPPVTKLIQTHLDLMLSLSPPESSHALDLKGLATEDIRFWSVWQEKTLVGMCAYKILDPAYFDDKNSARPMGGDSETVCREIKYAEIKSMHTIEKVRGQGIGRQMLDFLFKSAMKENISVFFWKQARSRDLKQHAVCMRQKVLTIVMLLQITKRIRIAYL